MYVYVHVIYIYICISVCVCYVMFRVIIIYYDNGVWPDLNSSSYNHAMIKMVDAIHATCVYIYIYMYTHIYVYICICIHTYIHTYIYIYIYTHTYIYIYIYRYRYIYIHIYIYIYIYIYTYTYIHMHTLSLYIYIYIYHYVYIYTIMHIYIYIHIGEGGIESGLEAPAADQPALLPPRPIRSVQPVVRPSIHILCPISYLSSHPVACPAHMSCRAWSVQIRSRPIRDRSGSWLRLWRTSRASAAAARRTAGWTSPSTTPGPSTSRRSHSHIHTYMSI